MFENVKGLTVGKHRKFLVELIGEFEKIGYRVVRDRRVLNASGYGVPQDRQRLFLLGAKRGMPLPVYPSQHAVEAGTVSELLYPAGPFCRDALDDLPDAEGFEALNATDEIITRGWEAHSDFAREMRCESTKAWHFGYPRRWCRELLTSSARTHHTEISRLRFAETEPGSVEPISRFFKLDANGVSNTLRAGTDASRGAFTSPRPIHYRFNRCVTVREMARLHGFPDWFRFHATKWHGARQIGNAVPPPLARAVADRIIAALGIVPFRPIKELDLGSRSLLTMDMRKAAEFWKTPLVIGKRDRKSGAKKRSQAETEAERLKLATA